MNLVFCHGWGASATIWDPLKPFLKQCVFWNYDELPLSLKNSSEKLIGVGHSLGFPKLLESGISFDMLIGIQTFTQFKPDIRPMLNAFRKNPVLTLQKFSKTSGVPVHFRNICYKKLEEDLQNLPLIHIIPNIPHLALASLDDPIVPVEYVYQQFKNIAIHPNGLHNLMAYDPAWCSQQILSYVHQNHKI